MRVVAAVPVLFLAAVFLFLGYAAFSAAGDVNLDVDWPTSYVVVSGFVFDGIGIAIVLVALRVLRINLNARWGVVAVTEAALATLPFTRFLDSKWGLLITAAVALCALTAIARARMEAQNRRS